MRVKPSGKYIFEYQAPETLDQASPVQNTWYTVGEVTNCIIYHVGLAIEDTNEDLALKVTADGETFEGTVSGATHSTNYYCYFAGASVDGIDFMSSSSTSHNFGKYSPFFAKSFKLEIRKTSANGAGNLKGIFTWGQLKPC